MTCVLCFVTTLLAASWLPAAEAALRGAAEQEVEPFLLALRRALRTDGEMPDVVVEHVAEHVERMRPIYQALPKSEEGFLKASAARYLSHRYFIDRRGWFVPTGREEAIDETLPTLLLQEHPLAAAFQSRLTRRGLSLLEVAALAAALEALVSIEAEKRLRRAFSIVGVAPGHRLGENDIGDIMKVYISGCKMGLDLSRTSKQRMSDILDNIYAQIPNWDALLAWSHEMRAEVLADAPELQRTFEGLLKVVETFQDRYAGWTNTECLSVKEHLRRHVTPGTGRVPLETFREVSLPRGWELRETVDRLREMGALDETDPTQPSVVLPNYFDISENCEIPSKYYSVCCISECEALMQHLEHELGSPNAHPRTIVAIVEKLPSAAVEAPRVMPELLVQRLETIAKAHGGYAKLHSRLFRQWMHHVYPSECTFPFLTNETASSLPGRAPESPNTSASEDLPWFDDDEDYLTCQGPPIEAFSRSSPGMVFRNVVLLVPVCGLALLVAKEARALLRRSLALKGSPKLWNYV